jgi:aconitate hydratase
MIELRKNQGILLLNGRDAIDYQDGLTPTDVQRIVSSFRGTERMLRKEEARRATMAFGILSAHQRVPESEGLKIRFDALASHDITYVGIVQTARASGLKNFPVPTR